MKLSCLFFLAFLGIAKAAEPAPKPNFILIFIDDMGYGDISPFGSKVHKTPHLKKMAEQGMKLTSFYAAPVCSPSRAALMTGCYPKRVGLGVGSTYGVLFPGDAWGLNPDELTVPELLKQEGYKTACIGKWHLGDQPKFLPTKHGFDYFYGLPYSNDMIPENDKRNFPPLPLMRNEKVLQEVKEQKDLTGNFLKETLSFIKTNKDKPFFVYLPHAMVHKPLVAGDQFKQATASELGDAIAEIDWGVGQILKTLKEEKIDRKTLVIFTSDNGPAVGTAHPLRGKKASIFEGGIRVPTIVHWPDKVPANSEYPHITSTMDILPTFITLAGGQIPTDRKIDGTDIRKVLLGQKKTPVYEKFFYYKKNVLGAVRAGDWKLFTTGKLYNLKRDISESKNAAAKNPDVVKKLKAYLDEAKKDLDNPTNCRPCGKASKPLRFLIPRPGGDHSPVKTKSKKH